MSQRLLVVVPAYNEAEHIQDVILAINSQLTKKDHVVVIDDGSTDNTRKVVDKLKIEVIAHPQNRGKGAAIKTGISYFLKEKYEFIIFIDADGQHNPAHIPKFMQYFQTSDVDIILANRFATSTWKSNMPFSRKLSNLLSRFGLWMLFNRLYIPDPQNGYRGYRREVLKQIDIKTNRYEAETEMIIDGYLQGFKFGFFGIESIYQPFHRTSKFSLFYDTWTIPGVMFRKFFAKRSWLPNKKDYH